MADIIPFPSPSTRKAGTQSRSCQGAESKAKDLMTWRLELHFPPRDPGETETENGFMEPKWPMRFGESQGSWVF